MTMRSWVGWVAAIAVLGACGDDKPDVGSGSGQCARRDNIGYIAKYTQRSGTCGQGDERVLPPGPQPAAGPVAAPCTGSISYSTDNCEVDYDTECPENGLVQGGKLRVVGHSKWDKGATFATAVEQWSTTNATGQTLCASTYDVTVTKQ